MKSLDLTPTNENVYNSLINDSIGRGEFVRQFVKMLNAIEDNCTIALEGNWGSGKTFFVKQVKMVLDAHNPNYQPVNGFLTEERRKAIKENGKIMIRQKMLPNGCVISVEDNGQGIPECDLNRITQAFYRVDKSRSRTQGGAGLGLSLCSKIVELHNGTLCIRSKLSEGTVVEVVLKGGAV